jgi:hypothetical protein
MMNYDNLASSDLFSMDIFSGGLDRGADLPIVGIVPGGGELTFINPKTDSVILTASFFTCMIFEFTCKTAPLGGVQDLTFRFTYTGAFPALDGAKIRIKVNNHVVGYVTLSSFKLNNYLLEGTGISIWVDVANFKPYQTFYRTNISLLQAIEEYSVWLKQMTRLEGFWWPVDNIITFDIEGDMLISSIDTDKMSVKEGLDMMVSLLGAYYEIRNNLMVIRSPQRMVKTFVYDIELERNLDTIVNRLDIFGLDRASETITLQQTIEDAESIRRYGIKKDRLEIPGYVNTDYNQYAHNMLSPSPKNTGSFKLLAIEPVLFDEYYIPYYEKNVIISLCNSLAGWSGDVRLVSHITNNLAVFVDGVATLEHKGAIDRVIIVGRGTFTIDFVSLDDSVSGEFDADDYAFKWFDVGMNIDKIVITSTAGTATLLTISGETSQISFTKVVPNEITYELSGMTVIATCEAGDDQSLVDFISSLRGNNRLLLNFVSK